MAGFSQVGQEALGGAVGCHGFPATDGGMWLAAGGIPGGAAPVFYHVAPLADEWP